MRRDVHPRHAAGTPETAAEGEKKGTLFAVGGWRNPSKCTRIKNLDKFCTATIWRRYQTAHPMGLSAKRRGFCRVSRMACAIHGIQRPTHRLFIRRAENPAAGWRPRREPRAPRGHSLDARIPYRGPRYRCRVSPKLVDPPAPTIRRPRSLKSRTSARQRNRRAELDGELHRCATLSVSGMHVPGSACSCACQVGCHPVTSRTCG